MSRNREARGQLFTRINHAVNSISGKKALRRHNEMMLSSSNHEPPIFDKGVSVTGNETDPVHIPASVFEEQKRHSAVLLNSYPEPMSFSSEGVVAEEDENVTADHEDVEPAIRARVKPLQPSRSTRPLRQFLATWEGSTIFDDIKTVKIWMGLNEEYVPDEEEDEEQFPNPFADRPPRTKRSARKPRRSTRETIRHMRALPHLARIVAGKKLQADGEEGRRRRRARQFKLPLPAKVVDLPININTAADESVAA